MLYSAKTIEDINNLINKGYDINQQDSMFGQTYLHILVKTNNPLLDYFLTKKPNPNIKNKEGKTPIFYANNSETIQKLIRYGASLTIKDNNGKYVHDYKFNSVQQVISNNLKNNYSNYF